MKTPSIYLEPNLIRQQRKKHEKYCELLAIGTLDTTMIEKLTGLLKTSENITTKKFNFILNGFRPKNEKMTTYGRKFEKQEYKLDKSARALSHIIKTWTHEPMVLTFEETQVLFKDFVYCRKDPSRKISKKNCMGTLDALFQDIFSCRLFGKWVHPKLCGPKKDCFSKLKPKTRMTELGGGRRTKGIIHT